MLRQRVVTALIIIGGFRRDLSAGTFPRSGATVCLSRLGWGVGMVIAGELPVSARTYRLCGRCALAESGVMDAGDGGRYRSRRCCAAVAGRCGHAVVRYALGAKVLSSGRLAVGPSVDSWANGLVDTDHDVGLCGVLSHADEGPLDGVLDDANGCHGGYWRLLCGQATGSASARLGD